MRPSTPESSSTRSSHRALVAAVLLAILAVAVFSALARIRHPLTRLDGDEGTFVAMATSLARDGDLRFTAADRTWAESYHEGPPTLILQRTDDGIAYSKPILYALWGAPFVRLLGSDGLVAANFTALALSLVLAHAFLRRREPPGRALLVLVTFAGAGALAAQVAWRMTESLQVALALAGLTLSFGSARKRREPEPGRVAGWLDHRAAPWIGAALLGLFASLRDPNLLLAGLPAAAALLAGRFRRAIALGLIAALAFGAALALTVALCGASNPYRAVRSSFDAASGYPDDLGPPHPYFSEHQATQTLELRPELEPRRSFAAAVTFLLGRHTGLFVYYPAVLAFLAAALRRPDRLAILLLGAAAALALFYVVWMPTNYFGGEAFLSNRYYLAALPLFLVAPRRLPGRLGLAIAWTLAIAVGASAYVSLQRTARLDASTQSHAHAGLFRLLPYETTGAPIGGRVDRYWSGDFLRFTDPYAEVGEWTFTLRSGEPAAEVVVASYWDRERPSFLAIVEGGPAKLAVTDWRGVHRTALPRPIDGVGRGVVTPKVAPPWRRHSYWWGPPGEIYGVRTLRLAVTALGSEPASVTFRYLGREATRRAAAELLEGALPATALASRQSILQLRVKNTGETTWASNAALPTLFGYRVTDADGRTLAEGRSTLARPVSPGEILDQELAVEWPAYAGTVTATIDLLREDYAWFGGDGSRPLLVGPVTLAPPP